MRHCPIMSDAQKFLRVSNQPQSASPIFIGPDGEKD